MRKPSASATDENALPEIGVARDTTPDTHFPEGPLICSEDTQLEQAAGRVARVRLELSVFQPPTASEESGGMMASAGAAGPGGNAHGRILRHRAVMAVVNG